MAAFANTLGENLVRTTGIVADNSDYTCTWWWRATAAHTDSVIYYFGNDPIALYTSYVLIYVVNSGGAKIKFSVGLNGATQDLATLIAYSVNQWYRISYVREGTDQKFYLNGNLIGSVTSDLSTVTDPFDTIMLFDDGYGAASADQQAAYFREWNRALTLTELVAEGGSPTAFSISGLLTDTSLFSDGIDLSGNGNDWTPTGAITYVDFFRVVTLSEFPITYTVTPADENDTYVFVYQGITGDNGIIGYFAGVSTLAGNYNPFTEVYKLTSMTASIPIGSLEDSKRIFSIPTTLDIPYYIRITDASGTNPPGRDVIFYFRASVITTPTDPNGLILILDDDASTPTVSGIVSPVTGEILENPIGLPKSENGVSSRFNGNVIITGKSSPILGNVYFYDNELNLLVLDTTTLSSSGQTNPPVAVSDNFFYAAQYVSGDGVIHLYRWDFDGILEGTSWDLPLPSGWTAVSNIGVSPDDSILYYDWARPAVPTADVIKRWDLLGNAPLSDFYTAGNKERTRDIIVNSLGDVFININNNSDDIYEIIRFDTAGNILNTYAVDSALGFADHIAFGIDDTVSFWLWQQLEDPADSSRFIFTFREYLISDGTIVTDITSPDFSEDASAEVPFGDVPTDFFGINNSCPLIILLNPTTPPPPVDMVGGIYKVVPWSRKPEDTLYTDVSAEETFDVKIPDPTFRLPLLGD